MTLLVARAIHWLKGLMENPKERFKALGVDAEDRILEVGCAVGHHTLALAEIASHGKVYALDIGEEGLAHLERRAGSCSTAIPLSHPEILDRSPTVDCVVCRRYELSMSWSGTARIRFEV